MTLLPRLGDVHSRRAMPRGLRPLPRAAVGAPGQPTQAPWRLTREHALATSALSWQHLRDDLTFALARTERALPGPLPAGDIEDDPDTGFVKHHQGAS